MDNGLVFEHENEKQNILQVNNCWKAIIAVVSTGKIFLTPISQKVSNHSMTSVLFFSCVKITNSI